jgi:lysophospholipase L1-like esterase
MHRRLALLAVLALVGCGRHPPTVWLFGDFVTGLYCHEVVTAHPEWKVECLGKDGETTQAGKDRLADALRTAQPRPEVVVIAEGTNDLGVLSLDYDTARRACRGDPAAAAAGAMETLRTMVASVRAVGATPILATTLYRCPVVSPGTCLELPPDDPTACPGLRCFYDGACELTALVRGAGEAWADFAIPTSEFADALRPKPSGSHLIAGRAAAAVQAALVRR